MSFWQRERNEVDSVVRWDLTGGEIGILVGPQAGWPTNRSPWVRRWKSSGLPTGKRKSRMSWRRDDVRLRITQRAPAKSARSSSSCDTCRRPACRVARPAGLHMGSVHLSELALDRLRGASCQPCMTLCSLPCFQGTPPDYLFAHKPCLCLSYRLPECFCVYFMFAFILWTYNSML